MEIICPFCNKEQSQKPIKSWIYGKIIEHKDKSGTKWGTPITVSRYLCKCGKFFQFYQNQKNSWTIPKKK